MRWGWFPGIFHNLSRPLEKSCGRLFPFTTEAGADKVWPCTRYDVRCTIEMFARVARDLALGSAYVRWTIGMFARVARGGGGEIPPMYDLGGSFIKLHKKSQSSFTKLHEKEESSFIKLHFTERNALTINVRDEIMSERE